MRIPTVGLAAVLLCAAPVAAGCSGSADRTSDSPSPSATRPAHSAGASSDQPTPSATAATAATAATRSSSPGPSGPSGPPGRLLPAADVAGLGDGYRWREADTSTGEPKRLFGTCQLFAMTSIGAERVAVRHYLPARTAFRRAGDRAGELLATFPDENTARRAFAVLEAWRGRCADRLPGHRHGDVGDSQDVPVTGGTGAWYLLTYGPVEGHPDARYLDAQGIAVVGRRIAMLSMVKVGEEHDDEPGHEPMVTTLRRAADLLR